MEKVCIEIPPLDVCSRGVLRGRILLYSWRILFIGFR